MFRSRLAVKLHGFKIYQPLFFFSKTRADRPMDTDGWSVYMRRALKSIGYPNPEKNSSTVLDTVGVQLHFQKLDISEFV